MVRSYRLHRLLMAVWPPYRRRFTRLWQAVQRELRKEPRG